MVKLLFELYFIGQFLLSVPLHIRDKPPIFLHHCTMPLKKSKQEKRIGKPLVEVYRFPASCHKRPPAIKNLWSLLVQIVRLNSPPQLTVEITRRPLLAQQAPRQRLRNTLYSCMTGAIP